MKRLYQIFGEDDEDYLNGPKFLHPCSTYKRMHRRLVDEICAEPVEMFEFAAVEFVTTYRLFFQYDFTGKIKKELFQALLQIMAQCLHQMIFDAEIVIRKPLSDEELLEKYYNLCKFLTVDKELYKVLFELVLYPNDLAKSLEVVSGPALTFLQTYLPYFDKEKAPKNVSLMERIRSVSYAVDTYGQFAEFLTIDEPLITMEKDLIQEEQISQEIRDQHYKTSISPACPTIKQWILSLLVIPADIHFNTECVCGEPLYDPGAIWMEQLIELPCGHSGHKNCIIDHFDEKRTCPLCRKSYTCEEHCDDCTRYKNVFG